MRDFRTGLLLTKVSDAHVHDCFMKHLDFPAEIYRRGGRYDLVFAYNLTEEIKYIRQHTDAKLFAIAAEPLNQWPSNYACDLVSLCDVYHSYSKPECQAFAGKYHQYTYPAFEADAFETTFQAGLQTPKCYDFCIFARHDPNCRREMAALLKGQSVFLGGPLFQNPVHSKQGIQFQSRYEFITENEITENYVSEKLGQSLLAGCVPVYLGGQRAHDLFPGDLFVDVNRFSSLEDVVRYCQTPEIYEGYQARFRHLAPKVLLEKHTWEANVIDPVAGYRNQLLASDFRNDRESLWWKKERLRRYAGDWRRSFFATRR
jgi:hypothetical protein